MSRITWKNLVGPSLADASRPLEAAQRSFDGAFTAMHSALDQHQATLKEREQELIKNNTQDFLDYVHGMDKATLADAMQSGAINEYMQRFGGKIDREVARGAAEGRLTGLRDNLRQQWAFDNDKRLENDRPFMAQAQQIMLEQGPEAAMAFVRQSGMSDEGITRIFGLADARGQELVTRHRDEIKFGRDGEAHSMNLRLGNANIGKIGAHTNLLGVQAQKARAALTYQDLVNAQFAFTGQPPGRSGGGSTREDTSGLFDPKDDNLLAGGTGATNLALETIKKGMSLNGIDPSDTKGQRILRKYGELVRRGGTDVIDPTTGKPLLGGDGEPLKIPPVASVFVEAISSSGGWGTWGTRAGVAGDQYDAYMQSPEGQRAVLESMARLQGPEGQRARAIIEALGVNQPTPRPTFQDLMEGVPPNSRNEDVLRILEDSVRR